MTTVEDLLKWSAALNEVGFFDAAFLRTMHEPVALTGGTRFPAYSLGLEHRQWVGAREVHHAGATAGYRAQVSSFPDQKLNIALLCNGSNTAPAAAVRKIAGLVLGRVLEAEGVPTQTSRLSESELNAFVGVYRDPRGVGSRRIVLDDKTPPGLRVFDGPTLLAQSATTLMLGDGSRFELTPKGLVLSTPRGVAQQWDRVAEVSPSAEQLKAYEGEYRSDEARASYRVAVESGRLTLKRAPYFVARLTAQFADGFESPFASVVFQRDANGKVVSMSMGDARVWNLSFLRVD